MSPSTSTTSPCIAIIGGGPSGLTLARILHLHNIRSVVFELDASESARQQGGTLDLHAHTGQAALHAAGIYPQFEKVMRSSGEAFRLGDNKGRLVIDLPGDGTRNEPEVDRVQLRKILLQALPEQAVHWGAKVTDVVPAPGGKGWAVEYADADGAPKSETFELVVGADGAWSKVRRVLMDARPHYSGVSGVELCITAVDERQPELSKLVGMGSYFSVHNAAGLFVQRNGDGNVRVYVYGLTPEEWEETCGVDFNNAAEAKAAVLEQFLEEWDDKLKDLVRLADDKVISRKLFMLPVGIRWEGKEGVTLMGDAAHLMTPFAGVGVNVAMWDAMTLGAAIVEHGEQGLAEAVKAYEAKMFPFAEENARETWVSLGITFNEDGLESIFHKMQKEMKIRAANQ
ncbi:monooxygenase [Tricharina praecox]|uniref:monooxygenase n=1 Tax=Tricharina praecox TaxID=43433 RepID=UPI00221E5E3E|nr:monooxygenase [Tricharina praecox]KAI5855485.1 monooxygenase [Tricharina praecox]